MTSPVAGIWLGEARAHLHAAVQAIDDPVQRRVHAGRAWAYAMRVLVFEDDAQGGERDRAALFAEEAAGHLDSCSVDRNQGRSTLGSELERRRR